MLIIFQIEDCLVCSEAQASVLFKPCNHMVACENCAPIMKKCVECRTAITESIPFSICCGAKQGESCSNFFIYSRTV